MSDDRESPRGRRRNEQPSLDEIFGSEQADKRFGSVEARLVRRLAAYIVPYRRPLLAARCW